MLKPLHDITTILGYILILSALINSFFVYGYKRYVDGILELSDTEETRNGVLLRYQEYVTDNRTMWIISTICFCIGAITNGHGS